MTPGIVFIYQVDVMTLLMGQWCARAIVCLEAVVWPDD